MLVVYYLLVALLCLGAASFAWWLDRQKREDERDDKERYGVLMTLLGLILLPLVSVVFAIMVIIGLLIELFSNKKEDSAKEMCECCPDCVEPNTTGDEFTVFRKGE